MRFAFLLLVFTATGPAFAQQAKSYGKYTHPQPPKIKPRDPLTISPADAVPENPEKVSWKITKGPATIVACDDRDRCSPVGTIPDGTQVKLEAQRNVKSVIYYQVPPEAVQMTLKYQLPKGSQLWVSGQNVIPAGAATSGQ